MSALHAAAYERSIASIRAVMDSERAALEAAGIPEDDVAEAMACIEAGIEDGLETLRHYALKRAEEGGVMQPIGDLAGAAVAVQKIAHQPGVYDWPESAYRHHPALAVSDAQRLLELSPYRWKWERDNAPVRESAAFDLGRVAHQLVLRDVETVAVIEADDWRTKAAKDAAAEARAAGRTPLLAKQYDEARAMADALHAHPEGHAAFARGKPEQSLIWSDGESGVLCKARPDWLPARGRYFGDYKTAASIHPEALRRTLFDHGHYMRAAWYLEGIRALGLAKDPVYLFVFQEKTPPYEVFPLRLSPTDLQMGHDRIARARRIYADCERRDRWPGWHDMRPTDEITTLSLPAWAESRLASQPDAEAFAPAAAAE